MQDGTVRLDVNAVYNEVKNQYEIDIELPWVPKEAVDLQILPHGVDLASTPRALAAGLCLDNHDVLLILVDDFSDQPMDDAVTASRAIVKRHGF